MVEADHTLAGRRDTAHGGPQEHLMFEMSRPILRLQADLLAAWATCVTYVARTYAHSVESIAKQAQDIVRQ